MPCLFCLKNTTRNGYETSPESFAGWYPMRFCSKECAYKYSRLIKVNFKLYYKVKILNECDMDERKRS